jgi:hypothetical protein
MATLVEINKKAQAIRKAHPRMKWNSAQKEAARVLNGTKKKSTPKKKSVTVTTRKKTVVSGMKKRSSGVSYSVASISSNINKLEKKLANTAPKSERALLIRLINADHAKIDAIERYAKSKTA